jgi:colanic acid/amylovoran biosynthesis glycosyltransferase
MKIAFIVEAFPALSQTFVLNQITGLIDRGHEVDIYAEIWDDKSKTHPDVAKYQLLDRTYYHPRIPTQKFQRFLQGFFIFVLNFFKDPLLLLRSLNVFKYGEYAASLRILYAAIPLLGKRPTYDIIQCHFGLLGRKGMLLRDIGAIDGQLITAFHGVDISQNIRLLGEDAYNDLFLAGNLFLPACDHWKRRLTELGCDPSQIIVHRMGIDIEKFAFTPRLGFQQGTIQLVTVARLTEKKGLEYSIQAVAKALTHYSDIRYTIIGSGPLKSKLEALIQELGLSGIVTLSGPKTREEIIETLSQSHIFLHPSVTASDGDQEASPVSIQEAMAMGLPVLSTFHGGIPELVENGISGFLVPERDAEALAEKLIYLIDHPEKWFDFSRTGRARIEQQHEINKLNDRLVSIYQHLLESDTPYQVGVEPEVGINDRPTPANL